MDLMNEMMMMILILKKLMSQVEYINSKKKKYLKIYIIFLEKKYVLITTGL